MCVSAQVATRALACYVFAGENALSHSATRLTMRSIEDSDVVLLMSRDAILSALMLNQALFVAEIESGSTERVAWLEACMK